MTAVESQSKSQSLFYHSNCAAMIIVTHMLFLKTEQGETPFTICVSKPERIDTHQWKCRYEIDWPEGARSFAAYGVDQLQALMMALYMIGAEINTSTYHKEGRLRAYDNEQGYGFPVMADLRDLLVGSDKIGQ